MNISNISHDKLNIDDLTCQHKSCKNVNSKNKEYVNCESNPKSDLKYCYSDLYIKRKMYLTK